MTWSTMNRHECFASSDSANFRTPNKLAKCTNVTNARTAFGSQNVKNQLAIARRASIPRSLQIASCCQQRHQNTQQTLAGDQS